MDLTDNEFNLLLKNRENNVIDALTPVDEDCNVKYPFRTRIKDHAKVNFNEYWVRKNGLPATGQQFKIEAARKPGPKKCCGAESYKNMFLVDEDLFPDPNLLKFISAADFKQGLQRVNEMTDEFKDRGQSPIFKLGCLFCLPLL